MGPLKESQIGYELLYEQATALDKTNISQNRPWTVLGAVVWKICIFFCTIGVLAVIHLLVVSIANTNKISTSCNCGALIREARSLKFVSTIQ